MALVMVAVARRGRGRVQLFSEQLTVGCPESDRIASKVRLTCHKSDRIVSKVWLACHKSDRIVSKVWLACHKSDRIVSKVWVACHKSDRIVSKVWLACAESDRIKVWSVVRAELTIYVESYGLWLVKVDCRTAGTTAAAQIL